MAYTAPPAVTNLTAEWIAPVSNIGNPDINAGVQLSWTAPTPTSGTIGGYKIYVTLFDDISKTVEQFLFSTIRRTVVKSGTSGLTYTIEAPATTSFFPFVWTPPHDYSFPAPRFIGADGNKQTFCQSYSFQVVSVLKEDPSLVSAPAGVTVFQPNVDPHQPPSHLNPRFNVNSISIFDPLNKNASSEPGNVTVMLQDSYEEVASCVEMVLNTPQMLRTVVPEFGIVDPTFSEGFDSGELTDSLRRWEPRAEVEIQASFDTSGITPNSLGGTDAIVNVNITNIEKNSY
jgi:hypothetical protein